jgi:hypothetical protein
MSLVGPRLTPPGRPGAGPLTEVHRPCARQAVDVVGAPAYDRKMGQGGQVLRCEGGLIRADIPYFPLREPRGLGISSALGGRPMPPTPICPPRSQSSPHRRLPPRCRTGRRDASLAAAGAAGLYYIACHIGGPILKMKTTLDISEPLLREARKIAAHDGTTLHELVEQGLRKIILDRKTAPSLRLRKTSVKGEGLTPEWRDADGDEIRDFTYKGRGG